MFLSLVAFDDFLVDEQVPHRVRSLSTFRDPIEDAIGLKCNGRRLNERVVCPEQLKIVTPWIFRLFGDDQSIGRLFRLADAAEADS